jgi:glycosyltransferase involved in cell wall biosynthesis
MKTIPLLSVVMPVYNGARYLREAINSILSQSFDQFEFIIINDGSTDSSEDIIRQYSDERICLLSQANCGLAATLNRGIGRSKGEYIARQDQDDISLPERFSRQIAYLNANPHCALVGTMAEILTEGLQTVKRFRLPSENAAIKFALLFNNCIVHSSAMLRREAVVRVGGYSIDPERQPPEDYELWSRMARIYEIGNIPEALHIYREVSTGMCHNGSSPFLEKTIKICSENIAWASNANPEDRDVINLARLAHSAWHLQINQLNFNRMKKLLHKAVERIATPETHRDLIREADTKLAEMQFKYLERRYQGHWLKHIVKLRKKGYGIHQRIIHLWAGLL